MALLRRRARPVIPISCTTLLSRHLLGLTASTPPGPHLFCALLRLLRLPFGSVRFSRENLLDLPPARLCERARALAGLQRLLARSGAVDYAAHNPLAYCGEAEHVVCRVVIPVLDVGAPSASAVHGHVLFLRRDSERR